VKTKIILAVTVATSVAGNLALGHGMKGVGDLSQFHLDEWRGRRSRRCSILGGGGRVAADRLVSHLHHCALLGRLELRRSHDVDWLRHHGIALPLPSE